MNYAKAKIGKSSVTSLFTKIENDSKYFGNSTIPKELQSVITGNSNLKTNAVGTVINSYGHTEDEETTRILTSSVRLCGQSHQGFNSKIQSCY